MWFVGLVDLEHYTAWDRKAIWTEAKSLAAHTFD